MMQTQSSDPYALGESQAIKDPTSTAAAQLLPIQDTDQSPQAQASFKKHLNAAQQHQQQQPPLTNGDSPMNLNDLVGAGQPPFRNHQVNYSFGQQPFAPDVQRSQRVGGADYSSGKNSMRNAAATAHASDTSRAVGVLKSNGQAAQRAGQVVSSLYSGGASDSNGNQTQSKGQKSAVSMASVLGQFDQVQTGSGIPPNIFAQSIQHNKQEFHSPTGGQPPVGVGVGGPSLGAQKPPITSKQKRSKKAKGLETDVTRQPGSMTQTQQNFATTAQKVNDMERLVSEGRSMGENRKSVHSLEAEKMGLRKSQEGIYVDVNRQAEGSADAQPQQSLKHGTTFVSKLAQKAQDLVADVADNPTESKVPDQIMNEMIQRGFRPSSKQDGQFEYDSDTVERYEMISNEFDYEEIRLGADFGIKQYKDCIYRGQLNQQRQREGLGVLVYQNGRVYEGEWLKNKRHGRGYEVFSNGNSYHGTYEEGKANGKGVYQWKNGEVYDGEWLQGIKNGYGVWKGTNGESYIGQWVQSKAQGYGVHVFANGDKYEGEWFQCLREGNGSDFFANGDCYVGQYAQGKPEGFGQYKWKNGSSYTGQFLNGLKHGHGKWKKKQADEFGQTKCNSYEGLYEQDKKHGYGVFEWESGNRYEGNYENDERHGYGVMRWTDESVYMGLWDQGIQHGVGVMIFPDGVKRAGIFEENVFKESLKRKDQIEPYRELLKDDCLAMLEEILSNREQSKANLFGPLNKSKAELLQSEVGNADLALGDSASALARGASEDRVVSNGNLLEIQTRAHDMVSDNASVINQPMRDADKEDQHQTMQKGNPMRDSLAKSIRKEPTGATIAKDLPPLPATATPHQNPKTNHIGRTIEVQTDLSMVTMEQYSQGYNSKAFMNKTHDFQTKQEKGEMHSLGSPNIKYQNDLTQQQQSFDQSNNEWQNVLQKPGFQDTKHQQEILGGGNPNEDTESEWNRNNSSMMVHKPNLFNATAASSVHGAKGGGNKLAGKRLARGLGTKNHSLASNGRRQRSNEPPQANRIPRKPNNAATYGPSNAYTPSPYSSHNRIEKARPGLIQPNPDRSLIPNRQAQRQERSLPPPQNTNQARQHQNAFGQGGGPPQGGDFVVPGPQHPSNKSKSINRHNVLSMIGQQQQPSQQYESSKRPPQKMFQSQYGNARFGQAHLASGAHQGVFSHNNSMMGQYPLGDSPDVHNRAPLPYGVHQPTLPHSENRRQSQIDGGLPLLALGGQGGARTQAMPSNIGDTPVEHINAQVNYPRNQLGLGPQGQYMTGQPPNNLPQQLFSGAGAVGPNPQNPNAHLIFHQPPQAREDVLTPSPKVTHHQQQFAAAAHRERHSKASDDHYNPHFNQSMGQQSFHARAHQQTDPRDKRNTHEMDISEHQSNVDGIAVEPMFGNDYGQSRAQKQAQYAEQRSRLGSVDQRAVDRGITTTSSQRTLRYNDFELIQKQFENDKDFEVHLDEADEKDSPGRLPNSIKGSASKTQSKGKLNTLQPAKQDSVAYPEIKMHRPPYESKDQGRVSRQSRANRGSNNQGPFVSTGQHKSSNLRTGGRASLPKMGLSQSIQQQERGEQKRRHLNSNDTQLASHTINMNASVHENSNREENGRILLPNQRVIQRSLPPPNGPSNQVPTSSRISVKQNISIMNPHEMPPRLGRVIVSGQGTGSGGVMNSPRIGVHEVGARLPNKLGSNGTKGGRNGKRDGSGSNSNSRFNFVGPYAQNLKKPKLYEARGTQKIALKNHMASLQQKTGGSSLLQKQAKGQQQQFNSEVFGSSKKQSLGGLGALIHDQQYQQVSLESQMDDRGDKHSHRFASHDVGPTDSNPNIAAASSGNYVIQHHGLSAQQRQDLTQDANLPHKRVWVPYNKKLKLKSMQQSMGQQQPQSVGTGASHPNSRFNANSQNRSGASNPLLNSN